MNGPANSKKRARHHAHLSLCSKSRKTSDAKLIKWPKTTIWAIFWRFWGQISLNSKFFWKISFTEIEGQKPIKSLEPFLRKISKCLILGQFADLFAKIFKSRFFFKNPALSLFYLHNPPWKKSEKSLEPFLRNLITNQTTNQPTNYYQRQQLYRTRLTLVQ